MPDCSCTHSSLPASSVKDLIPLAGVFKALGHPVRLMIVEMLLDGERCVCELQKDSGRDMSTISSHLNVLKNNRVLSWRTLWTNFLKCLTPGEECVLFPVLSVPSPGIRLFEGKSHSAEIRT